MQEVIKEKITFGMDRLNHCPRITLAFKPLHVILHDIFDIFAKSEPVGLARVILGS
jgi:hypothetical protein